jgi:hypothetical protein
MDDEAFDGLTDLGAVYLAEIEQLERERDDARSDFGRMSKHAGFLQEQHERQAAELARLRAEVERLRAAWPEGLHSRCVVELGEGWAVIKDGRAEVVGTRDAAIDAAAGLDAGDNTGAAGREG